jgi:hypothetical protein
VSEVFSFTREAVEEAWKMKTLQFVLLIILAVKTLSSPSGAPDLQAVCDNLTPGHGVAGQEDPSPFSLVISQTTAKGGETIRVEIQSSDGRTFRGFYIQARTNAAEFQMIGEFLEDESEASPFNFRSCGTGVNNAVTHANKDDKSSISFNWRAPENFVGTFSFQ